MQKFLIRDTDGEVFNKVVRPSVVMDIEDGLMLKIGEYEDMEEYHVFMCKRYREAGFDYMADNLAVMELPKDQEEIDKVFNISDYVGVLYKKFIK